MTNALWVAQGFAALVLLFTGALKVVTPKEKLAEKMHWAAAWPAGRIKLLGLAEVAGALGLVLPAALRIAPVLTPIAAVCLPCRCSRGPDAPASSRELRPALVPPARLRRDRRGSVSFWSVGEAMAKTLLSAPWCFWRRTRLSRSLRSLPSRVGPFSPFGYRGSTTSRNRWFLGRWSRHLVSRTTRPHPTETLSALIASACSLRSH